MKKTRIIQGQVFQESGAFLNRPLYILGERIVSEEEYQGCDTAEEIWDAAGSYIIPGLTDIHFHGCVGYDCCDGTVEALQAMAAYEVRQGVTSITPATMTLPEERLMEAARAAADYDRLASSETECADLCGLYMEGPFINPEKKGAQKEEYIKKPDLDMYRRLQEAAGGRFRAVAVAPEQDGALDFIRAVSAEAAVCVAHTTADYDTVCRAFEAGASQVTHLYNAMPPFSHRAPGPVGAAADHPKTLVELICDGVHIHPSVVRATFRMFGDDRIILISDSMRATGLPDGVSELGGQKVYKTGSKAALSDGTIAGSVTTLMDCMRTAVKDMGIPLGSAVKCAAVNPARSIGIYGDYGRTEPGSLANLAVLKEDLSLRQVFHRGRKVPDPA